MYITSLYLFSSFQLAWEIKRKKERSIRKFKIDTLNSHEVSLSTVKPHRHSFTGSIHTHRGLQPYYRCESCSDWLSQMLQWEKEFFSFSFSKSLAQVGTPSCCSGAKGNKPPKNGYGGKFSLLRGEAYKNKADGEREGEKIVFHSVTEVSKPDSSPHPELQQWLLSDCTWTESNRRHGSQTISSPNTQPLLALILVYCTSKSFILHLYHQPSFPLFCLIWPRHHVMFH